MPRPDQIIGADPFSAVLENNAAELAALHGGAGDMGPGPVGPVAPAAPGLGFPASLAPTTAADVLGGSGLPAHLAGGGASPVITDEQAATLGLVDPTPAALAAAVAPAAPDLDLAAPPWAKDDKPADKAEQGKKKKCSDCGAENKADALKCTKCGKALVGHKARDKANLSVEPEGPEVTAEHQAVIYNTQGLNLAVEADDDGLIWKVACKTGTLALSPGPGQMDLEKPLELSGDLFDDMLLSFEEKAFPYITVPETHANGALENTGYVRKAEALTRDELLADQRFAHVKDDIKAIIEADPEDTRYLLAGIEFTEPDVKGKAERGSIPDTSIGVKFGYRNKRTGKSYKAAWEHLALTPMPWIDGLIPFGLSQQGQPFDQANDDQTPYDGCYLPVDLELSTETRQRGAFSADQAKAQIEAMAPGDEWSWDYDVRVQALEDDDEDNEVVWLLQGGYIEGPSYTAPLPKLFADVDKLVAVVGARVAECVARREADRLRYAKAIYSVDGQEHEQLMLSGDEFTSIIHFDPKKHPRDFRGQFAKVLDDLPDKAKVELPGGTQVYRDPSGKWEITDKKGAVPDFVPNDFEKVADKAIEIDPDTPSPDEVDDYHEDPSRLTPEGQKQIADFLGDKDPHKKPPVGASVKVYDAQGKAGVLTHTVVEHHDDDTTTVKTPDAPSMGGGKTKRVPTKNLTTKLGSASPKKRDLSVQPPAEDGTEMSDEDLLALVQDDELLPELRASQIQETSEDMPNKTAAELLASQQADLEASQARVAELEERLARQEGLALSQGATLHEKNVNEEVVGYQNSGVAPALCLAAREILLKDESSYRGVEGEGLNLSVQVPKTGADGEFEEKILKTPTDVVRHLLASVPRGEVDAAGIANVVGQIGDLQLSAHSETNPEEDARKAVEALERQRHPERFDDEGKRKA